MPAHTARSLLRWTWIVVGVVALYTGGMYFQRWRANRALDASAAAERTKQDRQVVDRLGGGELKVLMFYATPPTIAKGAATKLCYGVAFAKTVRIEPDLGPTHPALNYCLEAKPDRTTSYTLTATDERGQTRTSKLEVAVQ